MRFSLSNVRFGRRTVSSAFLAMFASAPSFAATIFSNTHLVTHPRYGWQVQVDVNIFDNYQGDYTKSEWRYTVHNISYDPPKSDGILDIFGLSGLYLPFGQLLSTNPPSVTPLENFYWCGGCVYDDWGYRTGASSGVVGLFRVPVGSSVELSLLMQKPVLITDTTGVLFAQAALRQGSKYYSVYEMLLDIETPGVPEPATTAFVGLGLIAFAAVRIRTFRRK